MKYNNYLIDEEKADFTGETIYTVWEARGIYHLGTFNSLEEAKSFVDNKAAAEVAKINNMRRKNNR